MFGVWSWWSRFVSATPVEGGGGEAYTASAVHFDGNNSLITVDEAGPDESKFLFSVWIANTGTGEPPGGGGGDDNIPICSYPNGMFEFATLHNILIPGGSFPTSGLSAFLYSGLDYNGVQLNTDADVYPVVGWLHMAYSLDLAHADPDKRLQLYLNGVAAACTVSQANAESMTVSLSNETAFKIGFNGIAENYGVFDAADLQLWTGASPDLSDPANLAKLISAGKPVDPAVAAAEFGDQAILLSGDATGFAVNQGTLGTASLVGSLTNAATSPSD